MSFVTASLLFGGALALAIPIVLHLAMRQRPKHLEFPALRLLKPRRDTNRRQLRLRHWLLLLLRCGVIALAAFALARPRAASASFAAWLAAGLFAAGLAVCLTLAIASWGGGRSNWLSGAFGAAAVALAIALAASLFSAVGAGAPLPSGKDEAPVAAALVFDTSPRMLYRHRNQTRLEAARQAASLLLPQFPRESEVAVIESHAQRGAFAVDRSAAARAVERLEATHAPRPLPDVIASALDLVRQSPLERKEIYLFTDRTQPAWGQEFPATLRSRLADEDAALYVFDVGLDHPENVSIAQIRLSSERLAIGEDLIVEAELSHAGPAPATRTIEVLIEQPDPTRPLLRDGKAILPETTVRGRQQVELLPGENQWVSFSPLSQLGEGVHHGVVRLAGEDGLSVDNVRHFTVEARPPWRVLAAAPAGVEASLFTEAIAPYELRRLGKARFEVETIDPSELVKRPLEGFAAVTLLDPPSLPAEAWTRLAEFASRGGGVGVFLGRNAQIEALNMPEAQRILPGRLSRIWRSNDGLFLAPRSYDHPVLAPFRQIDTTVPWREFPIYKHWAFDSLSPDAHVVIRFNSGNPALFERRLGKGRTLTLATPVTDPAGVRASQPWSLLPTGADPWPYFILANEAALYLADSRGGRLNYTVGASASLPVESASLPERWQLFTPAGQWQEVAAREGAITIGFADAPGAYRLRPAAREGSSPRGFSVNLAEDAGDLSRAPRERLDEALGKGNYRYAQNWETFTREIHQGRAGREFFPLLMAMLALALGLEHLLANRFYRKAAA